MCLSSDPASTVSPASNDLRGAAHLESPKGTSTNVDVLVYTRTFALVINLSQHAQHGSGRHARQERLAHLLALFLGQYRPSKAVSTFLSRIGSVVTVEKDAFPIPCTMEATIPACGTRRQVFITFDMPPAALSRLSIVESMQDQKGKGLRTVPHPPKDRFLRVPTSGGRSLVCTDIVMPESVEASCRYVFSRHKSHPPA